MNKAKIKKLDNLISSPKKIIIIPHKNPDGDALGSCLALLHFLKNKSHDANIISPNNYPNFLKWLPGENSIIKFSENKKLAKRIIDNGSLIFALDFEGVVAGVSIELGAFTRCSRRYKYRFLKQFLVIADTGDPFSKFLGDCVTVLIALSAVEYCDSCACPAGRNADSSFDGCVHDLLPDVARLLGQGDHSRLNCAELRIFLRRMMSSLLQETG